MMIITVLMLKTDYREKRTYPINRNGLCHIHCFMDKEIIIEHTSLHAI